MCCSGLVGYIGPCCFETLHLFPFNLHYEIGELQAFLVQLSTSYSLTLITIQNSDQVACTSVTPPCILHHISVVLVKYDIFRDKVALGFICAATILRNS